MCNQFAEPASLRRVLQGIKNIIIFFNIIALQINFEVPFLPFPGKKIGAYPLDF